MTLPPLVREIVVPSTPEVAYLAWVDDIGAWWPMADHSVHEVDTTVAFEGGDVVERSADGQVELWGTVLAANPPTLLRFTWHPGRNADAATEIEVTFEAEAGGTRVVLTHTGWEAYPDAEAKRARYGEGWPGVLALLRAHVS